LRVEGVGCRVKMLGRVKGSECKVKDSGCRVEG